jgi:hypothetical protein
MCLYAALVASKGVSVAGGLVFKYADDGTLHIEVDGQARALSVEETRSLVAYLYDGRGELFGKPYDPDAPEESAPEPELVTVGSDQGDSLGDLDGEPF